MSIISAGIAEANNEWKDELVDKLETAVKLPDFPDEMDYSIALAQVHEIIKELKEFYFTE